MSNVAGGSSSQSSLTSTTDVSFNLHDEKEVISLLRKIHQSSLQVVEKNELRDTVFSFRNVPGVKVTPELQEKFSEYGFLLRDEADNADNADTVPNTTVVEKEVQESVMGLSRPQPRFTALQTQVAEVPKADMFDNTSAQNLQATVDQISKPDKTQESEVQIELDIQPTVQTDEPEDKTKTLATEVSVETPAPIVLGAAPLATPEQAEASLPEEKQAPSVSAENKAKTAARIKEIKLQVNQLAGNPVNLIDVNNEVGREYMNALLDAMKANSDGVPDKLAQAMLRLETSFDSVKETISTTKNTPEPTVSDTLQTEVRTPAVVGADILSPAIPTTPVSAVGEEVPFEVKQASATLAPVAESVADKSGGAPSGYAAAYQEREKAFEEKHSTSVSLDNNPVAEKTIQVVPKPPVQTQKVPEPVARTPVRTAPVNPIPAPPKKEVPVKQTQPTTIPKASGFVSVAVDKKEKDLVTDKKLEESVTNQQRVAAEVASMDPLMIPVVSNGLQQLLSEWSLFKSSGIFGTGPSGSEHALYKKLAPISMTDIVTGRFEGSTSEIKRSITDYMHGWRYEEGILHDKGETFEHYLRRVIKHILEKRTAPMPKGRATGR
ncbi:MAG: hypothetical protein ACI92I_000748 [Acidimicrobiales bacterium]|jgi:hypothetical protein